MKIIKKPLGPLSANCHVLIDEATGKAAVIDPGECNEELINILTSNGISSVEYILLTHGHFDHIMGVAELKRHYPDAIIAIHRLDAECLTDERKSLASTFDKCRGMQEAVQPDMLLDDNDEITLGSLKIKVLHTPGHTRGGVCYLCNDVIFTGDTLFARTAGRTDFDGGSSEDLERSIDRLGHLDGDYKLYPGHNTETTLAEERVKNRYMRKKVWS